MREVHVTRSIPAPADAVFDLLADHANYHRFPRIQASELIREGEPPPNGLGALRRIKSRPVTFEEEITAFERPSRLDYLILEVKDYLIAKLNVPFEHHGGSIRLSPKNGGTDVDWRSSYTVPTPIIGGLQERIWHRALVSGFRGVLEDVERKLT